MRPYHRPELLQFLGLQYFQPVQVANDPSDRVLYLHVCLEELLLLDVVNQLPGCRLPTQGFESLQSGSGVCPLELRFLSSSGQVFPPSSILL